MLDLFIPPSTRRLVLYPVPINLRWGPDRLRVACERDLGLTLDSTTAVVFHNRKKDTLVLYTLDRDGDRCITKKLERGAFLLPVPAEGEKYVVLAASKVASLFRA
jgi:hypothetical protein